MAFGPGAAPAMDRLVPFVFASRLPSLTMFWIFLSRLLFFLAVFLLADVRGIISELGELSGPLDSAGGMSSFKM